MKAIFGGFSALGMCYFLYLTTQMTFITEMISSQDECQMAAVNAARSMDPLAANSSIEKGCARMVRNGDMAEKVLNKMP